MNKAILITGSLLGLTSVVFGAFGAHSLKALIPLESLQVFETGVRYQMYHAILLLFVGGSSLIKTKVKCIIYYLVIIGVLLFSGSIYTLATNDLTNFNFKTIGFLTPIGGLLLIISWSLLVVNFFKTTSLNN